MMEVEPFYELLSTATPMLVTTLLNECSAITDYRTLRDTLPRRLAILLKCRCIIIYLRIGETLQFTSGTFDDTPGWSASLLTVAHINPIDLYSNVPEAVAWNTRHAVFSSPGGSTSSLVALPLIYRHHAIGVLVAYRNNQNQHTNCPNPAYWSENDGPTLEAIAGIVALLLENTRLLERDRGRIHELSLLNSISSQLSSSMYEFERVQRIVMQRSKGITHADLCELLQPEELPPASSWVSPELHVLLFSRFSEQQDSFASPLLIERPGDEPSNEYLSQLPATVKTFFAIPLFSTEWSSNNVRNRNDGTKVLGVIAGAYYQARKMRREELVLLHVLASQTGTVLENMHLMNDVIEARNHARRLLQQVLEDQRLKELMEEEHRRLDRLATLGEMSANVAHEVRNPLASIKTSMQMLKDDLADNENNIEEAQESAAIVLKEVERLDAIVRDLLLFARPRQLYAVPCNLIELSDHVLHMMHGQCSAAGVTVQRMYDDIPLIQVDAAQMEQVLFNLYMNALQAMPDGGTLTITCQVVSTYAATAKKRDHSLPIAFGVPIGVFVGEQQWLELAVRDTGTGIAPEQLERLFQPFFTTKAHGIGLGLPITRRLVEDHRGHLLVESQPGNGATFAIRLPIIENNGDVGVAQSL
ncbi:MAG TPA: ATP-binding protein [Ktedonobacteraceae bacterium]|nr:ATP-binding protein [Ktedonobacteraceae bacterium]